MCLKPGSKERVSVDTEERMQKLMEEIRKREDIIPLSMKSMKLSESWFWRAMVPWMQEDPQARPCSWRAAIGRCYLPSSNEYHLEAAHENDKDTLDNFLSRRKEPIKHPV